MNNVTNSLPSARNTFQPYKVPKANSTGNFTVKLECEGHYKEPDLTLTIPIDLLTNMQTMTFVMKYYVAQGTWESVMIHDAKGEEQGPADFKETKRAVEEEKKEAPKSRSRSPAYSSASTSSSMNQAR